MGNIKISDFEEAERQRQLYKSYKETSAPYFDQLHKIQSMMSNNVWCDITITATGFSQNCHECGNWFVYSKGAEKDKVELTISDNPERMQKATLTWLKTMESELKRKIRELASIYGFEADNLD